MPVTPTYPGVYIEEIPSGVRTITGVATSITAFIGRALRGPVNEAVRVQSFADFERKFGGLWVHSSMSYAVQHYFQPLRTEAVNGNLALEGTPRLTKAKTVGGDIQLTNAGADTLLSLSTVNGDVAVQTLNARTLELNTVNGDVRIAGWAGDRATLRTLSGDLDLSGSLAKSGRYDIESHSGDVRLAVGEQPGFDIEANTYSGRIQIDFSIKSEGPVRDVNRGPRSVRGTYGDAASSLRVQTFSGDIVVTRR